MAVGRDGWTPGRWVALGVGLQNRVVSSGMDRPPAALRLTPDVSSLTTSRDDLAHVLVEVIDSLGRRVPDGVVKVSFQASGAGAITGVDNGNPHNVDSFQRPRRWTWHGQALAVLRPAKTSGRVTLTARAEGFSRRA